MSYRVCHVTSAHPRYDIRIFQKECRTLAAVYTTSLVVADGKGDEQLHGVAIYDAGKPKGRRERILNGPRMVLAKAFDVDADVYHLHDPELLRIVGALKRKGKKVIFDAHEDLPKQILSKPWISAVLRYPISWLAYLYERAVLRKVDAVVAATPAIGKKFQSWGLRTSVVNNYPFIAELANDAPSNEKPSPPTLCYVGGITAIRGIEYMTEALALLTEQHRVLNLAGPFDEEPTRTKVRAMQGFRKVNELGALSRTEVAKLMAESRAGLVTFLPVPNHLEAQPNKMFEYMSAGLPVICSDFPLWRDLIERHRCGLCVDIRNPQSLADAIRYIFDHPKEAGEMGKRGRLAVTEECNWERESAELLALYASIHPPKKETHG
jgi:glycosyltransferase involved in cell wall biosynthesis